MNAQVLRNVRLYGQLGARFGRCHRLAVDSTAEAIRALSVTVAGFERFLMESRGIGMDFAVFIGKRNISQQELHFQANDDIRIAPIMVGAKNGGLLQIVLGVALIAASFFLPGSQAFLAGVFSAGASMVLGGIVQLLSPMPKDKKSKDKKDNEPNYAFNGPVNTQAQGNPVPVAYGGPMWIGSAVVSAGINVVDSVYLPVTTPDAAAATTLFNQLVAYYTFDNIATCSVAPAQAWLNITYGGGTGIAGYSTGVHGQQATMLNAAQVRGMYGSYGLGNWGWGAHVQVDDTVNTTTEFGLGTAGGHYSTDEYGAVVFIQTSTVGGMQKTYVWLSLFDNTLPGYVDSTYVEVSAGRHYFNIDHTAAGASSKVELYVDHVLAATINRTSAVPQSYVDKMLVQHNLDGAHNAQVPNDVLSHVKFDDWVLIDIKPTAAQWVYLANNSYSQIAADASFVVPSGTGYQGGDVWSLARESLGNP